MVFIGHLITAQFAIIRDDPNAQTYDRCDSLPAIGVKPTARVVHHTPIVVVSVQHHVAGTPLLKVDLPPRLNISPVYSDILVPMLRIPLLRKSVYWRICENFYNLPLKNF